MFMVRCFFALSLLLFISLLRGGVSSAETIYYVAPDGSDSKSGTQKSPWATVQHAVEKARPGDTVLVRGGIYQESEVWLRADHGHCGVPGSLLTIKAYPNEKPVFVNNARPFIVECDYLRIEGLHFKNGKSIGIRGLQRTTVQLVNNSFTGTGYTWDAIGSTGNNLLIEGNICDLQGNASVGTQGHCYYISHGTNIVIRNNVARGMTGYGIHVFDQRRGEDKPGFERLIKDVVIEGNVVSHSLERAGIILAAYDHARIENVVIRNNVVFKNATSGIYLPGMVSNVKIVNNTISGNRGAALSVYGTAQEVKNVTITNNIFDAARAAHVTNDKNNTTVTLENNLYWPGRPNLVKLQDPSAKTGDPLFVDTEHEDYHIKPGSAAIDRGTGAAELTADKDGRRRPRGAACDIGAYEIQ